jgi:hypothetical protein
LVPLDRLNNARFRTQPSQGRRFCGSITPRDLCHVLSPPAPAGAVSMDAIAREAGVSKATVYAHFAGKEELFGAVIGRECERYVARFSAGELDPCDVHASLAV